jgi:hypothetical protein
MRCRAFWRSLQQHDAHPSHAFHLLSPSLCCILSFEISLGVSEEPYGALDNHTHKEENAPEEYAKGEDDY